MNIKVCEEREQDNDCEKVFDRQKKGNYNKW